MTFQFKIQIKGISKPPVWRRVLVPAGFSFDRFHQVIQAAFPWTDTHLYSFSRNGYDAWPCIQLPNEDEFGESKNSQTTPLTDIFHSEGDGFMYTYDFGDDWLHVITLEKVLPEDSKHAALIAGKGKCPPEDCGGVWGYQNFLNGFDPFSDNIDFEDSAGWDPKDFSLENFSKNVANV